MTKTTTVTTVDDDVVPAPAAGNPSVQLHHDHEHHHHHSQYERTVGDDGTVHEKTVTEEVIREDPVKAIATAQASAQAQATVQPPAGGKKKNKKKGKVIEETTTTIIEEVTAPATRVKAASIRAPSIVLDPAPTVLAPAPTVAVPVSIAPPGSPTPSHRSVKSHKSHRSHHHPEIIVNVNVPTTNPPAPAAAAPPVIVAPIPRSPSVHAHHFPLPASNFPSPTASVRSMRLPKLHKSTAPTMAYVEAIPEGDEVEVGLGDEVVTKVITTTTTTGRPTSPPEAIQPRQLVTPPPEPVVYGNYVQNDPHYRPPPKTAPAPPTMPLTPVTPPPPAGRGGSPDSFIETTTVETVTYPISVVTGATTFGGAIMKGGTGARAGLSTVSATPAGTKGGLVPIPYIDYAALIRADSDVLRKATGNHHPKPSRHNSHHVHHTPAPPAPQTIATMSANLERDSKGNERLHATLRDHTGLHHIEEVLPNDSITTVAPNPTVVVDEEDEKKRRKEEKRRKKEEEKRAREPAYRPIEGDGGGLPPPKSERYAYPPAPTEIEQSARQRFLDRMGFGGGTPQGPMGAGPSMGGMVNRGWNGGPPFTPPGPATFPRPPPMMGSRPPMFGPPMMNPMMGMGMGGLGMGMGGMGMGGTCMGGMGLMGPPVPSMGMPYNPVPGMGMPMGGMGYGGMGGMGYGGRF